ncbi:MAG: nuclear transport factor 2 family protein [Gemmatimonadaceae bacterium]
MMTDDIIHQLEAELRAAQLSSDVSVLDRLIDETLVFTGPDGSIASKSDDLALHRERTVRFTKHEPGDVRIQHVSDDVVVVALRTHLAGTFHGEEFEGVYRYTRVWARRGSSWRVVAGHVSAVASND